MDVAQLPFNRVLGIRTCEDEPNGLFELPEDEKYHNHLGTVHAGALFALAEASSGQWLANRLMACATQLMPVLRRADIKYRKPVERRVYAKACVDEEAWTAFLDRLEGRGRALLTVPIELYNDKDELAAVGHFEWFVSKVV